jgi:23S rRNA (cytosine1962-C5)-methyltransferase
MPRPPRPETDRILPDEIPDRSLDIQGELATVAIRSNGQHPFVYRKMTIGPTGRVRPRDGDIVRVVDRDGLPLGFGLYNTRSQINVRMLLPGIEPPG